MADTQVLALGDRKASAYLVQLSNVQHVLCMSVRHYGTTLDHGTASSEKKRHVMQVSTYRYRSW